MNKTLEPLKALSDLNRLRVVAALQHSDELCACQIVELLKVTGATASRHMGILLQANVVESRKEGRWVYYKLSESLDPFLQKWLQQELISASALESDRNMLATIVACDPEELCRQQRGETCCPQ